MQNYKKSGAIVTRTAPSGGVVSGNAYKIGQLLLIAAVTVAETLPFEGVAVGEVETAQKATGEAWAEGALLYWDDTAKKFTTTAEENLLVGSAAAVAGSSATSGTVRLNGIALADTPAAES